MNTLPPTWALAIDAWARSLRAAGRASTTIELRTTHLRRLARCAGPRGPWDLDLEWLTDWTGSQPWEVETRRAYRSSLRAFYAWAVDVGRIAASPAEGLPRIARRSSLPRPAGEDACLIALEHAGPRELLMVRLAAEVGLRRGEVARVHSRDVSRDLVGWSLRVHGKGDKTRIVPLPGDVAALLRARPAGWAFPGGDHGHLSPWWVGRLVARLLPDGLTMHTLRHRFATRAYGATHDLLAVQELLGHASPATTRAYVRTDVASLRVVLEAAGLAA